MKRSLVTRPEKKPRAMLEYAKTGMPLLVYQSRASAFFGPLISTVPGAQGSQACSARL
jgi:hypothetical protein